MIKITKRDEKLLVESPYSSTFVRRAKQMGGQWDRPCWVFAARDEDIVRAALIEVYDHDGSPSASCDLRIVLAYTDAERGDSLLVGPVQVLRKVDRDITPKLGPGCVVVSGELFSRGGSRNNPRILHSDDCVIEVRDFPASVAAVLVERHPNAYQIVSQAKKTEVEIEQVGDGEVTLRADAETIARIVEMVKSL